MSLNALNHRPVLKICFGTHIKGETHKGLDSHISTCPFDNRLDNSVLIKLSSLSEICLFGNSNPGITHLKDI